MMNQNLNSFKCIYVIPNSRHFQEQVTFQQTQYHLQTIYLHNLHMDKTDKSNIKHQISLESIQIYDKFVLMSIFNISIWLECLSLLQHMIFEWIYRIILISLWSSKFILSIKIYSLIKWFENKVNIEQVESVLMFSVQ